MNTVLRMLHANLLTLIPSSSSEWCPRLIAAGAPETERRLPAYPAGFRKLSMISGPHSLIWRFTEMLKKLAGIAIAALLCLSFAQTVSPTYGNGADQFDVGGNSASVQQNVNLILPPAVALHLDVSELDFDMSLLGTDAADYVCVYGRSATDTNGDTFNNQVQWLPLGTSYAVAGNWSTSSEPRIEIRDAAGLVG